MVVQSVDFLECKVGAKMHPIQEIAQLLGNVRQADHDAQLETAHETTRCVVRGRRDAKWSRRVARQNTRNDKEAWLNS
jgi:hypothetical protein